MVPSGVAGGIQAPLVAFWELCGILVVKTARSRDEHHPPDPPPTAYVGGFVLRWS